MSPKNKNLRKVTPAVDFHASWIVLNPVQGCPKGCKYCFLDRIGQNKVRPQVVSSMESTFAELLSSPFYNEDIPLCFFTHTDPLATPSNRQLLLDYLRESHRLKIKNVKCFITKCPFDEDLIFELERLQKLGEKIVVYISLSGLDYNIEVSINHKKFIQSLDLLRISSFPVIHYWRPFLPQNSTPKVLCRVLEMVSGLAKASVAAGLKVYPEMVAELDFWPDLMDNPEVFNSEGVWPRGVLDFLTNLPSPYQQHPIFLTNSCALSYVLGEPDIAGYYESHPCLTHNNCPSTQRTKCSKAISQTLSEYELNEIAKLLGVNIFQISVVGSRGIEISGRDLTQGEVLLIRHKFKVNINSGSNGEYWNTSSTGALPLEINNYGDLIDEAVDLRKRFAVTESKKWDLTKGVSELVVQVGHLGLALELIETDSEIEEIGRNIHNVEDELSDCLFQIILVLLCIGIPKDEISDTISSTFAKQMTTDQQLTYNSAVVLSSQMVESLMKINGIRFASKRDLKYDDELAFLKDRSTLMLSHIVSLYKLCSINLTRSFMNMKEDAVSFLRTFTIDSKLSSDIKRNADYINERCRDIVS